MTIDRPDLSGAFTAPRERVDRAAGLTGLLPTARPRSTPANPPTGTLTAVESPTADRQLRRDDGRPAPARSKRFTASEEPRPSAVSETATTTTNVAVYLEPDLLDSTRTAIRAARITYDELVVRAFESIDEDALRVSLQPAGLPATLTMPARQRRLRGTAGIQIQLRLTGQQRAWLDTQVHQLRAPSRSALVAAALRLHLQPARHEEPVYDPDETRL